MLDDSQHGYYVKLASPSKGHQAVLSMPLKHSHLPRTLAYDYGEFVSEMGGFSFDWLYNRLDKYPAVKRLFRIYDRRTLSAICGEHLETGQDLMRSPLTFLYDRHAIRRKLSFVVSVRREVLFYCTACKWFVHGQCPRCSTNNEWLLPPALLSDQDINKYSSRLFTQVPVSAAKRSTGVFVVYLFDLETFTDSLTKELYPFMVCVSLSVVCANPDVGTAKLIDVCREKLGDACCFEPIKEGLTRCMIEHHFKPVSRHEGGMEYLPDSLGFTQWYPPGERAYDELCANIVSSQAAIAKWLEDFTVLTMLGSMYRAFQGPKACGKLHNVAVVSSSFNGQAFDELFLLKYRVFASKGSVENHEYFCKAGKVYRMNYAKLVNVPTEVGGVTVATKIRVNILLHDLCRFWVGSLRSVAKSLKLPVLKGFVDFDLVNAYYNKEYTGHETVTEDTLLVCEGMLKLDEEDRKQCIAEMRNHANPGGDTWNLMTLVFEYCMHDVVVTELALDVMQQNVEYLCTQLDLPRINCLDKIGIPAVSKALLQGYMLKNSISLYAPQDWALELIQESIYGGRSEVQVVGVWNAPMYLYDINSMYPCCMTAPYPLGPGATPSQEVLERFQRLLDSVRGVLVGVGGSYERTVSDIGFLFAYVDAEPPPDDQLRTWSPLPVRTKLGLNWTNEARERQAMCSQDMENLSRLGWKVTILRHGPALYWSDSTFKLKELLEFYVTERSKHRQTNEQYATVLKLCGNATYGKLLEAMVCEKYKFLNLSGAKGNMQTFDRFFDGTNDQVEVISSTSLYDTHAAREKATRRRRLEELVCKVEAEEFTDDEWDEYTTLRDADEAAELDEGKDYPDVQLVNYLDHSEEPVNRTPNQWGAFVLAYSRTLSIHTLVTAEGDEYLTRKPLKDRPLVLLASETDSFHLPAEAAARLPASFTSGDSGELGGWRPERKTFEFYVKLEAAAKYCYYVSKKFYYTITEDNGVKYACKGMAKESLTEQVLIDVMRTTYYDSCGQALKSFARDEPIRLSRSTLKRTVWGGKNSKDFSDALAAPIKSYCLARCVRPSFNLKRPHEMHQYEEPFLLINQVLRLLPFDADHPTPSSDKASDGRFTFPDDASDVDLGDDEWLFQDGI